MPGPARAPGSPAGGPFGAPATRIERQPRTAPAGHMIVCGDDALAHRLAGELHGVYGERVTLLVPVRPDAPPTPTARPGRALALFGRVTAAVTRTTAATGTATAGPATGAAGGEADGGEPAGTLRVVEAAEADDRALVDAGVERAAALALVHDDDETNIRAALTARRLNPRIRLVIRLYNRKLGQHLENLLDQAAAVAEPGLDPEKLDAATTVLSDVDTAAPGLAAAAVAGTSKVVQAGGLLLHAVERTPPAGAAPDPGRCTLALLSATAGDPAGCEGSERSGDDGPRLLPDDRTVAAATGRAAVTLEAVTAATPSLPAGRFGGTGLPVASLFSRRLRWSLAGAASAVLALALASTFTTGDHPLHAAYLTLLDIFAIGDPAVGESTSRQVLQILAGFVGLLLLPVIVAALLEGLGTFRTATTLRRPPRGLHGHVVLLGLGKVGTRVLARLRRMDIPVVCVESDPEARGIALARRLRVPTVIGDVTEEGVLEAARVHRADALLALTSVDITNLEAALSARSAAPDLRVVLRLYDDDFATAVYRTLRTAHPEALTRSRSVSHLAAPAFAGAMMGRQVLGAVPVERRVLLFAAVDVADHPLLEDRTVAQAFTPGAWRVIALDRGPGSYGVPYGAGASAQDWRLAPERVLGPGDRVIVAATRRGLAELLGRGGTTGRTPDNSSPVSGG
ncbi:potassium transporter TrkA [Streptomyces gardneri]|uniref:Potassium transporter TrkA n=2 Tax=Streptomyces gardneri TaxID=66892 RepID=A0A4Y3RBQ7_9ACTN|nr:potassium transporter TrkA [Streptomyces gardneri]GHG96393.1 potassium transporter TrkA [Streptomyces gardneri]